MIINRTYETQKPSVAVARFLPGRAKDLSAPLKCSWENFLFRYFKILYQVSEREQSKVQIKLFNISLLFPVVHSLPKKAILPTFSSWMTIPKYSTHLSQLPRDLRLRSTAARLLRSWVGIPPVAWKSVCCECRVLSGRGLCDELITRPEESYRLWCVVVCDLETTKILMNEEAKTHNRGYRTKRKKYILHILE